MRKCVFENEAWIYLLLTENHFLSQILTALLDNNLQIITSKDLLLELGEKLTKTMENNAIPRETAEAFLQEVAPLMKTVDYVPRDYNIPAIKDSRYVNLLFHTATEIFVVYNYGDYKAIDGFGGKINVVELENFSANLDIV